MSNFLILVFIFIPILYVQCSLPGSSQKFMYRKILDSSEKGVNFIVFWSFDIENITFETHVRTKGWFGFGLSSSGSMKGADVVMGWIRNGQVHFQDRHARGHETPSIDDSQDYELLHAEEIDEFTVFKFRRRLNTCDPKDMRIEEGTARLIYAWGQDEPDSNLRPLSYHHSNRGSQSVTLLDYTMVNDPSRPGKPEMDLPYFETLMGNISVPQAPTTYWCKFFPLPRLGRKHQIVKIDPVMDESNMGLIHHIVVYTCNQEHTDITSSEGEACYFKLLKPPNVTVCDSVIFAYAVGMEGFTFPDHVGFPIGREDDPRYFYLEVHYDNPHQLKGIRDNSGLRFYYTDKIRRYDAGVLEFGHTVWWPPMVIPPGAGNFRVDNYCSGHCTSRYIPKSGIRLIGALLHSHLAGHRMWIKHIRNGTELPEISRDDHYDFNYQQFRRFSREVVVLPGDELINTCEFRTKRRKKITYGGLSTHEEMCFNFVMYYPRIEMTKCLSTVYDVDRLSNYIHRKLKKGELEYLPKGPFQYLDDIQWNKKEIKRFRRSMFRADTYREYCEYRGNGAGPMVNRNYEVRPVIKIKYKQPKKNPCPLAPRNTTKKDPTPSKRRQNYVIVPKSNAAIFKQTMSNVNGICILILLALVLLPT